MIEKAVLITAGIVVACAMGSIVVVGMKADAREDQKHQVLLVACAREDGLLIDTLCVRKEILVPSMEMSVE